MSGVDHHDARIGRVETEVQSLRDGMTGLTNEVGSLKADVKGLGAILGRIEQGVMQAQDRADAHAVASKPNLVAIVSVLITLISMMVGGAWLISGGLATTSTRLDGQQEQIRVMMELRSRELDQMQKQVERVEDRGRATP